jgi:CDP-glycerol glycerophosphotransferase (TagB/SpsB family)
MPTYRSQLLKNNSDSTGARPYDGTFRRSEYFVFYNKLMHDPRIISALQASNMMAEFYIHPNFAAQIRDFTGNERVGVIKFPYDYRQAFSEGSLLVTDYSSVAFDFAYLRKPIIYAQFDGDTFFEGHSYAKGYFDYERDGFGPVCGDYKAAVKGITNSIRNTSALRDSYKNRIEMFFEYDDRDNGRRVYDAIIKHGIMKSI